MLTAARLESLTDVADTDRLIDGLGRAGLPLSLTQRVRLASSPSCCAALALRRLAEITFGPTRLSRRLTRSLLSRQQPDGSWESDPLATACAVAALQRIVAEHRADDTPRLAMRRGEWALASMQRPDGLLVGAADRDEDAAASVSALILYLLDRIDSAWEAVRRTDLAVCVQSKAHRLAEAERLLLEMAIPAGESGERRRPEPGIAGGDRHETGVVAMPPRMEPVVSTVAA